MLSVANPTAPISNTSAQGTLAITIGLPYEVTVQSKVHTPTNAVSKTVRSVANATESLKTRRLREGVGNQRAERDIEGTAASYGRRTGGRDALLRESSVVFYSLAEHDSAAQHGQAIADLHGSESVDQ